MILLALRIANVMFQAEYDAIPWGNNPQPGAVHRTGHCGSKVELLLFVGDLDRDSVNVSADQ